MKNITAVLIAGGLMFVSTGCASQLSTAETCAQAKAVIVGASASGSFSDMSKSDIQALVGKLRPVADRASDAVKQPLQAAVNFYAEQAKDNPDEHKLSSLRDGMQKSGSVLGQVCGS